MAKLHFAGSVVLNDAYVRSYSINWTADVMVYLLLWSLETGHGDADNDLINFLNFSTYALRRLKVKLCTAMFTKRTGWRRFCLWLSRHLLPLSYVESGLKIRRAWHGMASLEVFQCSNEVIQKCLPLASVAFDIWDKTAHVWVTSSSSICPENWKVPFDLKWQKYHYLKNVYVVYFS